MGGRGSYEQRLPLRDLQGRKQRDGSRRAMQTLDKIIRWASSTTPISVDERYQTDQAAGSGKSKRYDAATPGDRFDWRRPLKLSRVLGVAGQRRVGERRRETAWGCATDRADQRSPPTGLSGETTRVKNYRFR